MAENPRTPRGNKIFKAALVLVILLLLAGAAGLWWIRHQTRSAPANQLTVTELGTPFPFEWGNHRIGDRLIENAFQIVPVRFEGLDRTLWMQLELGRKTTEFFEAPLKSLAAKGVEIPIKRSQGANRVWDLTFQVGTTKVTAKSIRVIPRGEEVPWDEPDRRVLLGYLGADWIEGQALVIDYPKTQLTLLGELSSKDGIPEASLAPFSFAGRRIMLPVEIDGAAQKVRFDTGSSAFELLVDGESLQALAAPGAKDEPFFSSAMGHQIQIHSIASNAEITFAGRTLPLRRVSSIEWPSSWQRWLTTLAGDGAMCGNQLFLKHRLVLDTRGERFAVLD